MNCSCGGELEARHAMTPERVGAIVDATLSEPTETERMLMRRAKYNNRKGRSAKRRLPRERFLNRQAATLGATLMAASAKPRFVCTRCGRQEGFYRAIGRSLIAVEPMPQGALPVYFAKPKEDVLVVHAKDTSPSDDEMRLVVEAIKLKGLRSR